jgi:hypothetical protein
MDSQAGRRRFDPGRPLHTFFRHSSYLGHHSITTLNFESASTPNQHPNLAEEPTANCCPRETLVFPRMILLRDGASGVRLQRIRRGHPHCSPRRYRRQCFGFSMNTGSRSTDLFALSSASRALSTSKAGLPGSRRAGRASHLQNDDHL